MYMHACNSSTQNKPLLTGMESSPKDVPPDDGIDGSRVERIRVTYRAYGKYLVVSLIFYIGALRCEPYLSPLIGTRAESKQYTSFEAFYPFYITQHEDRMCKVMHFIGTTIVLNMIAFRFELLLSMIPAYLVGSGIQAMTSSMNNGIVEGLGTIVVFLCTAKLLTQDLLWPALVLLVGYGFAWVGHYVFENNRPATFIYPVYSLASDFRLWFELASTQRTFD